MTASASSNGFLYYRIDQSRTPAMEALMARTKRQTLLIERSLGHDSAFLRQLYDPAGKITRSLSNFTVNFFPSAYDFKQFITDQQSSRSLQTKISSIQSLYPNVSRCMNVICGLFQTIPNYGPSNPFSPLLPYYFIVTISNPSPKLLHKCMKIWRVLQNNNLNAGSIQLSFTNAHTPSPYVLWPIGCLNKPLLKRTCPLLSPLSKLNHISIRSFKSSP